MKKIVFTLLTVFALAFMAGGAFAQTNRTPYIGETYSYTLNGITVTNASTAVVTYSDPTHVTLPANISIATSDHSITFDVTYLAGAAATGILTVTITDNITDCFNLINLEIKPTATPTLQLAVTSSKTETCQNRNASPDDNKAANIDAADNTFTFTVTPSTTGTLGSGATYSFNFDLDDYLFGTTTAITIAHTSGPGTITPNVATGQIVVSEVDATDLTAQVFTVTFATTTGIATEAITGTASVAKLQSGGTNNDEYDGTYNTASASVNVKSMPAIGTFE
jgi:hypothetical protein